MQVTDRQPPTQNARLSPESMLLSASNENERVANSDRMSCNGNLSADCSKLPHSTRATMSKVWKGQDTSGMG